MLNLNRPSLLSFSLFVFVKCSSFEGLLVLLHCFLLTDGCLQKPFFMLFLSYSFLKVLPLLSKQENKHKGI